MCITWNRIQDYQFYRNRVYKLEEDGHDTTDYYAAMKRSEEWNDRIPIGIFYQEDRPVYRLGFTQLAKEPLINHPTRPKGLADLLLELT